jgi:hypothetical protein
MPYSTGILTAMTRRFAIAMVLLCTALGAGVLVYAGPYRGLIRGALGDVIAVVWLAFLFQAVWVRWPFRRCLVLTTLVAGGLEAIQGLGWVPADAPRAVRVILGATYDPHDFIAYGIGLGIAWLIAFWVQRSRKNSEVFGASQNSG